MRDSGVALGTTSGADRGNPASAGGDRDKPAPRWTRVGPGPRRDSIPATTSLHRRPGIDLRGRPPDSQGRRQTRRAAFMAGRRTLWTPPFAGAGGRGGPRRLTPLARPDRAAGTPLGDSFGRSPPEALPGQGAVAPHGRFAESRKRPVPGHRSKAGIDAQRRSQPLRPPDGAPRAADGRDWQLGRSPIRFLLSRSRPARAAADHGSAFRCDLAVPVPFRSWGASVVHRSGFGRGA